MTGEVAEDYDLLTNYSSGQVRQLVQIRMSQQKRPAGFANEPARYSNGNLEEQEYDSRGHFAVPNWQPYFEYTDSLLTPTSSVTLPLALESSWNPLASELLLLKHGKRGTTVQV